jgi:hypothetical protein
VKKKRLLLVGDNDDVRAVFREGLEAYGFEVVAAASVNQALRLISTEKFDVLLSDLHMPDAGDGFTVVSAMRQGAGPTGTGPEVVPRELAGAGTDCVLNQYFAATRASCSALNCGLKEINLCRQGAHRTTGSLNRRPSTDNTPETFSGEILCSSRLPQIPHRAYKRYRRGIARA